MFLDVAQDVDRKIKFHTTFVRCLSIVQTFVWFNSGQIAFFFSRPCTLNCQQRRLLIVGRLHHTGSDILSIAEVRGQQTGLGIFRSAAAI